MGLPWDYYGFTHISDFSNSGYPPHFAHVLLFTVNCQLSNLYYSFFSLSPNTPPQKLRMCPFRSIRLLTTNVIPLIEYAMSVLPLIAYEETAGKGMKVVGLIIAIADAIEKHNLQN
jgi:hypothetical protein